MMEAVPAGQGNLCRCWSRCVAADTPPMGQSWSRNTPSPSREWGSGAPPKLGGGYRLLFPTPTLGLSLPQQGVLYVRLLCCSLTMKSSQRVPVIPTGHLRARGEQRG